MARIPKPAPILRVHANPYASLDKDGFPAGQTRHDPVAGLKGVVHFIGAEVKRILAPEENLRAGANNRARRTRVTARGGPDMRQPIFDFEVDHWLGIVDIPDTEYHRRRLRKGELIVADEATARAAGTLVKGKGGMVFIQPEEVLKAARESAIAEWKATYPDTALPLNQWPNFTFLPPATPDAATPPFAPPAPVAPSPLRESGMGSNSESDTSEVTPPSTRAPVTNPPTSAPPAAPRGV